jgi:hypothetical protein
VKNAKMDKSDLTLSTFTQYVEDFKFWVQVAGEPHKVPEKELAKMFVSGLKPESLRDAIGESRAKLAVYRESLDITERMKKSEVKKSNKNSAPSEVSKKPGKVNATAKVGSTSKSMDLKDVECYHCHKKGHFANKCPEIKAKESKRVFKVRKVKEVDEPKPDEPGIRQIRFRYSEGWSYMRAHSVQCVRLDQGVRGLSKNQIPT